ncbi:MAG: SRPBCC family protein [Acidimicrobiales bacterium]
MPTETFEVLARSAADPKTVFDLLADIPAWAAWGKPLVPRSIRERDGAPDPNGVGAVRKAGGLGIWVREEIVEYIPPVRLAYILVSGMPVRRYRSIVELEADPAGGTAIRWRSHFEPKIPGTGPLFRVLIKTEVGALARRLATRAGQR